MALSHDELVRENRALLRRLVQEKARADLLERRLLMEKGRHLRAAQEIDEDIARIGNQRERQVTGAEMDRIAHGARPAISLELLDG